MNAFLSCRRQWALTLCVVSLGALATGCDSEDGAMLPDTDVAGRVMREDHAPATGATVYLTWSPGFFFPSVPVVTDSTYADNAGFFGFDVENDGQYRVHAGIWSRSGQYALVSPMSAVLDVSPAKTVRTADLRLQVVTDDGSVTGIVMYVSEYSVDPVEGANVVLNRYLGGEAVAVAEGLTDAVGRYLFDDVATGNYVVSASHEMPLEAPYPFVVFGESGAFFCDGNGPVVAETIHLSDTQVDKPAIYLYPETEQEVQVTLDCADFVRLTASEPPYDDGWRVLAAPSGRLEDRWDYLFYEVAMRGAPRPPTGWCLAGDDLERQLGAVVRTLGLNDAETDDFLDYWLKRLPRRAYWIVRPVIGAEVDSMVGLDVQPAPDSVLRFWLFFQGSSTRVALPGPDPLPFERTGFTVVEWGGAIVR